MNDISYFHDSMLLIVEGSGVVPPIIQFQAAPHAYPPLYFRSHFEGAEIRDTISWMWFLSMLRYMFQLRHQTSTQTSEPCSPPTLAIMQHRLLLAKIIPIFSLKHQYQTNHPKISFRQSKRLSSLARVHDPSWRANLLQCANMARPSTRWQ